MLGNQIVSTPQQPTNAKVSRSRPTAPVLPRSKQRLLRFAPFHASALFAAAQAGMSHAQTMACLRKTQEDRAHIQPWSCLLQRAIERRSMEQESALFAMWNSDIGSHTIPNRAFELGLVSDRADEQLAAVAYGSLCDQRKAWLVLDGLNEHHSPHAWAYFHAQRRRHPNWVLPDPVFPIDGLDARGSSLLHWAARSCPADFLGFLIDQGVCPRTVDHDGRNALHHASHFQREGAHFEPIADLLLGHGLSVDAHGAAGESALHVAAARGSRAWCSLLLARGADPQQRDARGRTALDRVPRRDRHGTRACLASVALAGALPPSFVSHPRVRL